MMIGFEKTAAVPFAPRERVLAATAREEAAD
jgi:hypothetical protein